MKQALILDETVVKKTIEDAMVSDKGQQFGKSSLKILSSHQNLLKVWGKNKLN